MTKFIWFVCLGLLVSHYLFQTYINDGDFSNGLIFIWAISSIIIFIILLVLLQSYVIHVKENKEKTLTILGTIFLILLTAFAPFIVMILPKLSF